MSEDAEFDCGDSVRAALFDQDSWHPEALGRKYVIFECRTDATLVALYIDPPPATARWPVPKGQSATKSFFELTRPVVESLPAQLLYLTYNDRAWVECHWAYPFSTDYWTSLLLLHFEVIPAAESGEQFLVLLISDPIGAIVFTRYRGFEIAYYGDSGVWHRLAAALNLEE